MKKDKQRIKDHGKSMAERIKILEDENKTVAKKYQLLEKEERKLREKYIKSTISPASNLKRQMSYSNNLNHAMRKKRESICVAKIEKNQADENKQKD